MNDGYQAHMLSTKGWGISGSSYSTGYITPRTWSYTTTSGGEYTWMTATAYNYPSVFSAPRPYITLNKNTKTI